MRLLAVNNKRGIWVNALVGEPIKSDKDAITEQDYACMIEHDPEDQWDIFVGRPDADWVKDKMTVIPVICTF